MTDSEQTTDGEQATKKEKLIDFILSLTTEEADKIIAFLQDIKEEQP